MEEKITWVDTKDRLPDDEMTVMINRPSINEPVWLGYYSAGCWYTVDGVMLPCMDAEYWAEMPSGVIS